MHDNLRNLGLDALDVVNLRLMFDVHGPAEGSIEAPLTALAELQRQGLVRHIGLSNVTPKQIDEGRAIADIVCVQNQYNLAHRRRRRVDRSARRRRHRLCAVLPARRLHAVAVDGAVRCRQEPRRHADAGGARLAAAARAEHPADSRHLVGCRICVKILRRPTLSCRRMW